MRLGVAWVPSGNAQYRAFQPMRAMARRGHEIVWPIDEGGQVDVRRVATCDLVHVYRYNDENSRRVLADLAERGTPFTYDNDDDFTTVPKESPNYKEVGGLRGQRVFAGTVKIARMARWFSTTNEVLAEKYRRAGVPRVEVIGNYLTPDIFRPRGSHEGIVVGWVAGLDHRVDATRIGIGGALARLQEKHAEVRVECIGVDLGLSQRYRHDPLVPFEDLPERIGGFDIGIAPLADIPFNRARSDIKLKEYAASGVPWLASPVGPYLGLGEEQGGLLVADDGWFEALDRLVTQHEERQLLARNAHGWAKTQTIEVVADRWEQLFFQAAGHPPMHMPSAKRRVRVRLRPPPGNS